MGMRDALEHADQPATSFGREARERVRQRIAGDRLGDPRQQGASLWHGERAEQRRYFALLTVKRFVDGLAEARWTFDHRAQLGGDRQLPSRC